MCMSDTFPQDSSGCQAMSAAIHLFAFLLLCIWSEMSNFLELCIKITVIKLSFSARNYEDVEFA